CASNYYFYATDYW
nr:immunoglobulin heavy chain junction region [Mus musculus]